MDISTRVIKRFLIGRPLATDEAPHQTISKTVGLAVFASDALSSVAYAPGEILLVLLAGGLLSTWIALPIAVAITVMLVILTVSYRQTIFAYPSGGGAYIVARDNIGETPAQVAGAALLTDYILTVAVSITSGWENVAATFPAIRPYQTALSAATIVFMTIINLRGVKESGRLFAAPTYFFIGMLFVTMVTAALRYAGGSLPVIQHPAETMEALRNSAQSLSLLLVLRAFSSGCTALTGVEAISNGIQAFKEPKSRNAATTMLAMSALIAVNFIGIVFFAGKMNVLPQFEVLSNGHIIGDSAVLPYMTQALFGGDSIFHWMLVVATMLILMMAANTSYADFPRLSSLLAGDGFLPRQLTFKGSRLTFSWGIVGLALASIALVIIFQGSTSALIPLYAIGVFLSFAISQAGMVVRWRKTSTLKPGEERREEHSVLHYDKHWRIKMAINAVGAVMAFIVMVDDVHVGTVQMVDFAMSEGNPWIAVHLDDNPVKTARIEAKWNERMSECGHELILVPCPYRNLSETAVEFVQHKLSEHPDRFVHVVMGQLVMDTWQAQALHANTNVSFYIALQSMERVAITNVTYQIHKPEPEPVAPPVALPTAPGSAAPRQN